MASESKKREVLQLLREYRAYWSPFGGARPLDETHVSEAAYGPAGYVETGMYYTKSQREALRQSYERLEYAITIEKAHPEGFLTWVLLQSSYFGDPADPSIVAEWRKTPGHRIRRHDSFVERLSHHLRNVDLSVVWPKRMSSREEKQVERMNDEFYSLYRRLREEGTKKRAAIQQAATMCGYSESRGYEIVRIRDGKAS